MDRWKEMRRREKNILGHKQTILLVCYLIRKRGESCYTSSDPFFIVCFAFVIDKTNFIRWHVDPHNKVSRVAGGRKGASS